MSGGVIVYSSPGWTSPFPSPDDYSDYSENLNQPFEAPISSEQPLLTQNLALISSTTLESVKDKSFEVKISKPSTSLVIKDNLSSPQDRLNSQLSKHLLSMIAASPTNYRGKVTPESLFGCHLVAGRLQDQYDEPTQRLVYTTTVRNDYFGIIAEEQVQGRTLIAMDKDWILPLIAEYLQTDQDRAIHRTEDLREKIATYNPIRFMGEPYVGWESVPELVREGPSWLIQDLSIYSFNDLGIGQRSQQTTWDEYDSSVMLVFAPVNAEVAGAVNTYLYQYPERYASKSYLAVRDLPVRYARDFEYLYPVELTYLRDYVVFSSLVMTRQQLIDGLYRQEVSRKFPSLDPKLATYASFLLAESTFYQFPLFWQNQTLTIQKVGYLQGQDLFEQFTRLLIDIQSHRVYFQPIPSFEIARKLAQSTDIKCFYFEGNYYGSVPEEIKLPLADSDSDSDAFDESEDRSVYLIEMRGPLQSYPDYPETTLGYLSSLGYQINPNPEVFLRDLPLGYRTFQYQGQRVTAYYYRSTIGEDVQVYQHEGDWSRELFNVLQIRTNQGYFAGTYLRNILQGYPDYVPSYPAQIKPLSYYPEKARLQLESASL